MKTRWQGVLVLFLLLGGSVSLQAWPMDPVNENSVSQKKTAEEASSAFAEENNEQPAAKEILKDASTLLKSIDHQAAWKEAVQAGQEAELARRKDWTLRIEFPEITKALELWEQASRLKKRALEQEVDPFQQTLLETEYCWAKAEKAIWIAKENIEKARAVTAATEIERKYWSEAAQKELAAAASWDEVIKKKKNLLILFSDALTDAHVQKEIEAEVVWATAQSMTATTLAAMYEARSKDPNHKEIFEQAWERVAQEAQRPAIAWEEVCLVYQNFIQEIPEEQKSLWQDRFE